MATISITEGFVGALSNDTPYNMVEVNFSGIPDGVEVMITHTADNMTDNAVDDMKVTLTGEGAPPGSPETMVEVACWTTMEMVISLTPFPMQVRWLREIR